MNPSRAAATPPFVLHCLELLEPVGPVRARRMFGGWGLYAQDLFIAIIAFDRLYLKTDAATESSFEQAGGERFVFEAEGKSVSMRYWTPPAEALDSPALMLPWARRAVQAALTARAPAKTPARRARSRPATR